MNTSQPSGDQPGADFSMDPANLYREDTFTDHRVGTVRRLTPVRSDGSDDDTRRVQYLGQTQMLTPMGALPLNFEIEATSLEEAVAGFAAAARQAAEQAIEEIREMRRDAASSIVVPGSDQGGMGGAGSGGGNLQFP